MNKRMKLTLVLFSILTYIQGQDIIRNSILLKYDFKNEHPLDFNMNNNEIFVLVGKKVLSFDFNGLLLREFSFGGNFYNNFETKIIDDTLKLYFLSNDKLFIYNESVLTRCISLKNCQNFHVNNEGVVFFDFQEILNSNNYLVDTPYWRLGSYNPRTNKVIKYNLKVHSLIQAIDTSGTIEWISYDKFFSFNPKLNLFNEKVHYFPFDGTSKVIGKMNNKRYINFYGGNNIDSFYIYDESKNKIDSKLVNFNFQALHSSVKKNVDFRMENHSGLDYFYDGANTIYYMRYINLGCEIGLLEYVLK